MRLSLAVLALLFVAVPCLADDGADVTDEPVRAEMGGDGVQRIAVFGGEYYFRPSHIIVKAGMPVELTVRKGAVLIPHNIVMDAPESGMQFTVDFGSDGEVISFTPTRVGRYPFYCDKRFLFFKSHRKKGMEGLLEVVP
jgi:plastocyanin